MAKTLKQFLEGYLKVKSADEQKFIDKHVTAKNPDRNGNGDDVFKGSTKPIDRRKDRKGYNPGEDEKVYEAAVCAYDKDNKIVGRYKDIDTAKKMKPGHKYVKEELKGNQHKIDANKNGKVDAHDFKLLRGKKKVAEAADDPKLAFQLHMAKKREELRKKGQLAKEEVDQIDELSHDTLRGYRMKAKSIADHGGEQRTKGRELAGRKSYGGKMAGIEKAKVMAKEEVDQIDELSKATLGSYANKAKDDMSRSEYLAGKKMGERMHGAKPDNAERKLNVKTSKRYKGLGMAINKLAKEEVEELDEKLTAKTPMGTYIKDFQKSDAPQFKGKSAKKRQVMAIAAKLSAERGGKPLRKEERLQNRINDLSESHQRTMMNVFEKLNEDNKSKFLEACDAPDGVEQMLDFAINNRGE